MRTTRGDVRSIPVQWEELTASDFPGAVKRAQGVCVLPIGVIEKHGPHLPLGTDVMAARAAAIGAAQREYAVVFPHYYTTSGRSTRRDTSQGASRSRRSC